MGQSVAAEWCCSLGRSTVAVGSKAAKANACSTSAAPLTGARSADMLRLMPAAEAGQDETRQVRLVCSGVDSSISHGFFLGEDPRPVWDVYEQQSRRGCGPFGSVFQAKERKSGTVVAMKKIELTSTLGSAGEAVSEFKRCAQVSHPNLARVFTFFNTPAAIYIVSELAAHGDIWEYIVTDPERTKEVWISEAVAQVLSALIFLHQMALVHGGVKPSNILVTGQHLSWDPSVPVVLLSDFGTGFLCLAAAVCDSGALELLRTDSYCGPAAYCGPEVFHGHTGDRTDVYALGATLYELLSGQRPAAFKSNAADKKKIGVSTCKIEVMDADVDWTPLQSVSEQGQALVQRMMAKAYESRPSAVECSIDEWFGANDESCVSAGIAEEESRIRMERMQRRACQFTYSKELLNMIASQLSGDLLQKEREVFKEIDRDGSGVISVDELLNAFKDKGWDQERALAALKYFDIDASGSLGFTEWIAATMDLEVAKSDVLRSHIQSLFAQLDRDGNGAIELKELRDRFGNLSAEQDKQLVAFFKYLDKDGDGAISMAEFELFWSGMA